jgi:hypothetical protein
MLSYPKDATGFIEQAAYDSAAMSHSGQAALVPTPKATVVPRERSFRPASEPLIRPLAVGVGGWQ